MTLKLLDRSLGRVSALAVLTLAACADDGTAGSQTDGSTSSAASTSGQTTVDTNPPTSTTNPTSTTDVTTTVGTMTSTGSTGNTTDMTSGSTGNVTATTDSSTTDISTSSTTDVSTSSTTDVSSSSTTMPPPCPEDQLICEANTSKICDGMGGFKSETPCDPGVCVEPFGCLACNPGEAKCEGNVSKICKEDGSGFVDTTCDDVQGVMCDANSGQCVGACSPNELGLSYIGCEYFPTVNANIVTTTFSFAVVVANASNNQANIRIDRGANIVVQDTVAAGAVKVIKLPWVNELKGDANSASTKVVDGAYRLRSNQPITVYQYNPLEYSIGGFNFSYTNDASLLLPVNTWSGDYWVVSRNLWNFSNSTLYPGFYAVTAAQDGTQVTLAPSQTGKIVKAGGGVAADGTGVVMLDQGDVLEVYGGQNGGPGQNPNPSPNDLTGTHVTATKPIQLISGHVCTFVPHNIGYCDHLEESIPPYETLGKEIIVTSPLIPTGGNQPKAQLVRIVATEDNTTLTYDPAVPGAPAMIATAGSYVELPQSTADYKVTSNNKIIVSQYMLGQDAGGNSGDPAMALGVPIDQYRTKYLFHAPINYEKNYVNIVAKMGSNVTLDGGAVANFTAIGGTGYGIARVALPNNVDGNHDITSNQPIGISVYGYGQYTSYWYPGGLDLTLIPM